MTLRNFTRKRALKDFEFHSYDDDEDFLHTNNMDDDEAQKESSIHKCDHITNLFMTH